MLIRRFQGQAVPMGGSVGVEFLPCIRSCVVYEEMKGLQNFDRFRSGVSRVVVCVVFCEDKVQRGGVICVVWLVVLHLELLISSYL